MSQKRTVIGALDYSLEYLKGVKRELLDLGSQKQEIAWAIGGLVVALSANLLKIFDEVIQENKTNLVVSADNDLREIQKRFNAFIDNMLAGNKNL